MDLYLGIDFGTSSAKAVVIDSSGTLQTLVRSPYPDGTADALPQAWSTTLWALMAQIDRHQRAHIQAIAVDGTSGTILLCDAMGQPQTAPLLYNDDRGTEAMDWLQGIAPRNHVVLSPTSSLAKLLWWQAAGIIADDLALLHQADWLAFLLHGQVGLSDYHNALKLGYDAARLNYPDWLLNLAIAPLLPRVLAPGAVMAPIQPAVAQDWGLPSGCLVRAGTTDSIAAFLASGARSPGEGVTSLGSTLVLKLLSKTPVNDTQYGIYSHRLGNLWLVGGASNTGGAVLQQFFSPAALQELSCHIDSSQESPLDYYPLIRPGERFPINDPDWPPRLDPMPQDPVQFLHGLLAGMARIETQGYQLLQDLGATHFTRLYTVGGGAKNQAWNAIRARHLQVSIQPAQQTEAAYGTALLAGQLWMESIAQP